MSSSSDSLDDLDALLPPGVLREQGPAPQPQEHFDERFVLPEHYEKPLQLLFPDKHSADLVFHEKPHVYYFRGRPVSLSVTGLAHAFETPFDPVAAVEMMRTSRSQSYPRYPYLVDAQSIAPDDASFRLPPERGVVMVCDGKTVSTLQPHSVTAPATRTQLCTLLDATKVKGATANAADDDVELYSFAREQTTEEIQAGWKQKGKLASNLGTNGHWICEMFANGLPCQWWSAELRVFLDFARTYLLPRGIVAHRTEWEIMYPPADLAGSIDLILYEPARALYHVLDYKRADKLESKLRGYGKMKGLEHLDQSNGAAYALQLSIYQFILETEYGLPIGERILLSIHPEVPFATSVPYLKAEVEWLFREREALVRARAKAADADPSLRCALTGAPLVDAVVLADGRLLTEKAAQVAADAAAEAGAELAYEPADEVRARFAAAVQAQLEEVAPLDASQCLSWKRRMPVGGIRPFSA